MCTFRCRRKGRGKKEREKENWKERNAKKQRNKDEKDQIKFKTSFILLRNEKNDHSQGMPMIDSF